MTSNDKILTIKVKDYIFILFLRSPIKTLSDKNTKLALLSSSSVPRLFITYMIPWANWLAKLRNSARRFYHVAHKTAAFHLIK